MKTCSTLAATLTRPVRPSILVSVLELCTGDQDASLAQERRKSAAAAGAGVHLGRSLEMATPSTD